MARIDRARRNADLARGGTGYGPVPSGIDPSYCHVARQVRTNDHAALGASRHQSAFDTFVWMTLLPRCCYVVKQELLHIPLFGKLIIGSRMIAIDRTAGSAALRALLREGDRAVREGRQIVIFPEGTRGEPGYV